MPPFSGYPTFPQYFYNAYTPSPTQMHYSLPPAPSQPAYRTQFSDSIADEQDPLEKLVVYFTWLAEKSPMQADALMIAKKILMDIQDIGKVVSSEIRKHRDSRRHSDAAAFIY